MKSRLQVFVKTPPANIEARTDIESIQDNAPSIAVLPFDDMSERGDQGYFCEGIAEEILNALSRYTPT